MNKVVLVGNIVRENVVSNNGNVLRVANTIAVNRQGENTVTDFINIVAFGECGEAFNKYVSKGNRVVIQGALHFNNIKQSDGSFRTFTNVIVSHFKAV